MCVNSYTSRKFPEISHAVDFSSRAENHSGKHNNETADLSDPHSLSLQFLTFSNQLNQQASSFEIVSQAMPVLELLDQDMLLRVSVLNVRKQTFS